MKTLKLTAEDFKKSSSYWKNYVGKTDVSDFDGHIEIDDNLGWVRFDSLKAKGNILAKAGTSITAGESITAGTSITAGNGIKAGWSIEAGTSITAGESITAGLSITAGTSITAGESIKTSESITAGLSINCKLTLSAAYRVFAGICTWKKVASDEDKTITCGKFNGGEIAYGILKETGLPNEETRSGEEITLIIDDVERKAILK